MVKRCIAAGCCNTNGDGISLHKFPSDGLIRKQWTKQVQKIRPKWSGPSDFSVLCSDHFMEDCFEPDSALASKMGLEKRKRLKPDAVPTIFKRPALRLAREGVDVYRASSSRKRSRASTSGAASQAVITKPKRIRSALEKGVRSRILVDLLASSQNQTDKSVVAEGEVDDYLEPKIEPSSFDQQKYSNCTVQTSVDRRNAQIQVNPTRNSVGLQADIKPEVRDMGVQCSLPGGREVGVQCTMEGPTSSSAPKSESETSGIDGDNLQLEDKT